MMKKIKNQKGFTLIELMVVIVIIGILVAIALPNFIGAQDRAKLANVKSNMHTFQTIVETYAVDWGGTYPQNIAEANNQATQAANPYWKSLTNPFTSATNAITNATKPATTTSTAVMLTGQTAATLQGLTGYLGNATNSTVYAVYGADKAGSYIKDKGVVLTLSNS